MNRLSKMIVVIALLLLVAVPVVSAQEQNIVEIAVADGRFDTLAAAVVAAELDGALAGGEWTVFAPTDDAFAKLGLDASNVADAFSKEDLTDILLYHALPSNVTSADAKTMLGDITMANGKLAGLKYFDGSLWLNDDAQVIIPDVVASNGTVHVVDSVILPPWPRNADESAELPGSTSSDSAPAAGNSIAAIASNDSRFSTLVAAVVAADLAGALSSGEWTVFAPTNDAFAKLGLDAGNIADAFTKEELTDILLYHVLTSNVTVADAKAMLGDVTMANGNLAGLKYFDGSIWVNDDSQVIIPDIVADNGTIHVVDNVILPPWPRE